MFKSKKIYLLVVLSLIFNLVVFADLVQAYVDPDLADLYPTFITTVQDEYFTGERVDLSGSIFNGGADTEKSFTIFMYINEEGDRNINNWVKHYQEFEPLGANGTRMIDVWSWTPEKAGRYVINLTADIYGDIPESSSGGINTIEKTITVKEGAPVISGTKLSVEDTQVIVTWTTDIAASSFVFYGLGSETCCSTWQGSETLTTSHKVVVPSLKPSTTYKYNIRSGNSDDVITKTETKTFTTTAEMPDGPVIRDEELSILPTQATVRWTTDVPASSFVNYTKRGQSSWSWQGNDSLVTTHTVVLPDLESLTAYEYKIKSEDAGGTMTTSDVRIFTTTDQITQIETHAELIIEDDFDSILAELAELRNLVKEQEARIKYLEGVLLKEAEALSSDAEDAINDFIVYGVDKNTIKLGAGERAGVVNSFKSSFGKLPTTATDWQDVIKIANGRWPTQRSTSKEAQAKEAFAKIYLRTPDTTQPNDDAAVTVMAYGLRPAARNTDSEKAAIKSFEYIYGHSPTSAFDWDIVRAIAYSGASR